ncbi:hypothetical protein [Actinocatenispora rupis]|uniref:Uncharacterized protein n=1 Tax=Actinocatenispora rupis TaxID=519421 RepID=A0A8J3IYL2_9ACTN|nr:hypothetical protein [Actinocatenispora rupis]GID12431.1 hypothetical protein Aru02nite_33200 [Actinocatenispora rupis]
MTESASVAVCPRCHRPVVVRDRGEYTVERAALIVANGLCVCPPAKAPTPPGDGTDPLDS